MIKLGLNNLKDIKVGSTNIAKVMLGPNLIWEKIGEVVGTLLERFIARVDTDGGTWSSVNEGEIVDGGELLLLTPNAYKVEKLYSALPEDGTGDFVVDRNSVVQIINSSGLLEDVAANVPAIEYEMDETQGWVEKIGENSYPNSRDFYPLHTTTDTEVTLSVSATTPPTGITYGYDTTSGYIVWKDAVWMNAYQGIQKRWVSVYSTSNYNIKIRISGSTGSFTTSGVISTTTDVGGGWYRTVAEVSFPTYSSAQYRRISIYSSTTNVLGGFQVSETLEGLDSYIETTGTELPYGNYSDPRPLTGNTYIKVGTPIQNLVPDANFSKGSDTSFSVESSSSYVSPIENDDTYRLVDSSSSNYGGDWASKFLGDLNGDYTLIYYSRHRPTTATGDGTISFSTSSNSASGVTNTLMSNTTLLPSYWYKIVVTATLSGNTYLFADPKYAATYYFSGIMVKEGTHLDDSTLEFIPYGTNIIGDIITTTPPTGTQAIVETIDGVDNTITTIPATYQLPAGNVNKVKMLNYIP